MVTFILRDQENVEWEEIRQEWVYTKNYQLESLGYRSRLTFKSSACEISSGLNTVKEYTNYKGILKYSPKTQKQRGLIHI